MDAQGILLETGTNEMEFLEFTVGEEHYGINVAKIRQILQYDSESLIDVQGASPEIIGTILFQERAISLVDIAKCLNIDKKENNERQIALVCEFNQGITGFLVDTVEMIRRISWKELHPVSNALAKHSPPLTGFINTEEHEVLILDFENILAKLMPNTMAPLSQIGHIDAPKSYDPAEKYLVIVDDSQMFRLGLIQTLEKANYANITQFDNGQSAYEYIQELIDAPEASESFPDIVITDVEMPQLDGFALCKQLKAQRPNLPVVIMSSLVKEDDARYELVSANAGLSKKQIKELPALIESLLS